MSQSWDDHKGHLSVSASLFFPRAGVVKGHNVILVRVFNSLRNVVGSHQHPTEQPAMPAACSSLHDYEYVHYPCLVDGVRTRPVTPKGEFTVIQVHVHAI